MIAPMIVLKKNRRKKMKYKYLYDLVSLEHLQKCLDEAGKNGWKLIMMEKFGKEKYILIYIKKI